LQKNKSIFQLDKLPLEAFASALGLPGAPKVNFIDKEMAKRRKNQSRQTQIAAAQADAEDSNTGTDSEDEAAELSEREKSSEPQRNSEPAKTNVSSFSSMVEWV
jgi:ATP-dependent RNA helicase DDX10/DBP4